MATHGLRPLRQLGQNFLAEPALATVIAHALPKSTQEPVQEIGPGLGALTRALLTIGHTVEAFEIDQGLISWLRQSLQNEPRFQLIEGDALKTLPHHPPRSLVCGNLPYSISTPLLVQLALRSPPPRDHRRHPAKRGGRPVRRATPNFRLRRSLRAPPIRFSD